MAIQNKPTVLFVLSVDTEEEWDWTTEFPQADVKVENIQALTTFQEKCENIGIRPTYFVDYPVADNLHSANVLKQISASGNCEIGAHLHPWCNPPIEGDNGDFESHLVNLPVELVEKKLAYLLDKLKSVFETDVTTFRSGRWGINAELMTMLKNNGIRTDSSVYPYYRNEYFHCDNAPLEPYWPSVNNPLLADEDGQRSILEFPVSAGFNHSAFNLCDRIHRFLSKPPMSTFRLPGIAWQLKFLRKIYLSPELSSASDMKSLINVLLKRKSKVIHMNFHSSSLIDLPYQNHGYNSAQIINNMTDAIRYLQQKSNVTFCTLSEARQRLLDSQA